MRDMQPPITSDQELAGYKAGLARFNAIVATREHTLFASQHDPQRLEAAIGNSIACIANARACSTRLPPTNNSTTSPTLLDTNQQI